MNTKTLVGAVIGGLALFVMGFLIYDLLLADYFAISIARTPPNLPVIIIGEIVFGYLITSTLSNAGATSVSDGAKSAAMLGFIIGVGLGLIQYGATTITDLTHYLADAVVWAVRWAVAGAAVGWWLGRDS